MRRRISSAAAHRRSRPTPLHPPRGNATTEGSGCGRGATGGSGRPSRARSTPCSSLDPPPQRDPLRPGTPCRTGARRRAGARSPGSARLHTVAGRLVTLGNSFPDPSPLPSPARPVVTSRQPLAEMRRPANAGPAPQWARHMQRDLRLACDNDGPGGKDMEFRANRLSFLIDDGGRHDGAA